VNLDIDVSSHEPVYEQIVRQIQTGVQNGNLPPGTPLPSIRQLAVDLNLTPNTVARAYQILESHRIIRTAGRKGTFVNSDATLHVKNRNHHDATYEVGELIATLLRKGLSIKQIETAFRAAIGSLREKGSH
jgi:GntR family transcriptional regulator